MAHLHSKIWLVLAVLTAAVGATTLFSLQVFPSTTLGYDYARILGWGGLVSAAVLVVQGFWKAARDRKYMDELRKGTPPQNIQDISQKYTEARVHGWRGMHVILSILVTTLAAFHSFFLLPRLAFPTVGVLLGVAGLGLLLILGLSGVAIEARRKTATFGLLKKLHLWLMVSVLTLIELHAVAAGSTIARMGPTVTIGLLIGTIGMIGVGVEYASIKGTKSYFNQLTRKDIRDGCQVNLARRAALQKIGTVAVGTLVAISFAEAAALMPKILTSFPAQSATQQLVVPPSTSQPIVQTQAGGQTVGTKLGNLASIPVNSAYYFQYPAGSSNILIRLANGSLVAYSSTCTHQPCTVGYDSASGLIRCPCHGAVFDPAHGAAVLQGPAPTPLLSIHLTVDANGDIWLA